MIRLTKAVTLIFFAITFAVNGQIMSDSEMTGTYWKYRDQLKKYFMKVGLERGESIPMSTNGVGFDILNYSTTNQADISTAHWRDATISQGHPFIPQGKPANHCCSISLNKS